MKAHNAVTFIILIDSQKKKIKYYLKYIRVLQCDFRRKERKNSLNISGCPFPFLKIICNVISQNCEMAFRDDRYTSLRRLHAATEMGEMLSFLTRDKGFGWR